MGIEYDLVSGVRLQYGPRDTDVGVVGSQWTYGQVQELVVEFDYNNLPSVKNAGKDATNHFIPKNSLITAAYFETTEDWTSSTTTDDLQVGTEKADGTDIDTDGIDTSAVTNMDGSNVGWVVCDGAQVGASVGTSDAYIVVTSNGSGTLSTGAAKLVVQYVLP